MANTAGSGKSGLFTGFFTGTALCLGLGAAASYVNPIPTQGEPGRTNAPDVQLSDGKSVLNDPGAGTTAVLTPKSDGELTKVETPQKENPEADRDDPNVSASVRDAIEKVQTGSPEVVSPDASVKLDAKTADIETQPKQTLKVAPLATVEKAPEASVARAVVPEATQNQPVVSIETNQAVLPRANEVVKAAEKPQLEGSKDETSNLAEIGNNDEGEDASATPSATALQQPKLTTPETNGTVLALNETPSILSNSGAGLPKQSAPKAPKMDDAPKFQTSLLQPKPKEEAAAQEEPANDTAEASAEPDTADNEVPEADRPITTPEFDGRAFEAFAVEFSGDTSKPYLAIILEHTGKSSVNMYDLLNFATPITFGVPIEDRMASWRENEFRKAGFEVVALIPESGEQTITQTLDEASVPSRINNYLTSVPGAVALLDTPQSDLHRNPQLVSSLSEELEKSGRGLLIHERFGVNRALEAARSAGIPAASMVRVIDEQLDAASIRRSLDRAALDASKTGAAIVFGHTHPETIAALLPWLLGNSAKSVTLAPLTATMNRMAE